MTHAFPTRRSSDIWASHGTPDLSKAWDAARAAGLDVESARPKLELPEISAALSQDSSDVRVARITQTPTFFVNGKRSAEPTSELQSLMRISYAVFCLTTQTQPDSQTGHATL